MGKMHLAIIASAFAFLAGCAETAIFEDPKTGDIIECEPILESCLSSWNGCSLRAKFPNHTCIAALTERGYVRLTGDDADECRSHATDPDGTISRTRFSDCMNDMVRRGR